MQTKTKLASSMHATPRCSSAMQTRTVWMVRAAQAAQAARGAELVRRAARKRPRRNRHRRRGQEGRLPRSSSRVGAAAAAWSAMLLLSTAHMGKVGVLWAWSAMLLLPTGPQHTEGTPTLRRLQAQPRHAQPRHPPRPIPCSQRSEKSGQRPPQRPRQRPRQRSERNGQPRHRDVSASLTKLKRRPTT